MHETVRAEDEQIARNAAQYLTQLAPAARIANATPNTTHARNAARTHAPPHTRNAARTHATQRRTPAAPQHARSPRPPRYTTQLAPARLAIHAARA